MNNKIVPIIALVLLLLAAGLKWGPEYVVTPIIGPQEIAVVIVEERGDRFGLPREQLQAITSVELRDYCEQHNYPLRILDDDVTAPKGKELSGYVKTALAMAKAGGKLPWLIVVSKTGSVLVDEPLGSEGDMLSAVKKYGG